MAWKYINKRSSIKSAFAMTLTNKCFIVRGLNFVAMWGQEEDKIKWIKNFHDDHIFGYKNIFTTKNHIFGVFHENEDPKRPFLTALELETGKLAWRKPINWILNRNLGGIHIVSEGIIVIQNEKDPLLTIYDKNTGNIISSKKWSRAVHKSILQDGFQIAVIENDELFICMSGKGLCSIKVRKGKIKTSFLTKGNPLRLKKFGKYLLLLMWDDKNILKCFDSRSHALIREFDIPNIEIESMLFISSQPNRNAFPDILILKKQDGEGIISMNLESGKILWENNDNEDWNIYDIINTPKGILILMDLNNEKGLYLFNPISGNISPILLPLKANTTLGNNSFWINNQLWIDTSDGLCCYEWQNSNK